MSHSSFILRVLLFPPFQKLALDSTLVVGHSVTTPSENFLYPPSPGPKTSDTGDVVTISKDNNIGAPTPVATSTPDTQPETTDPGSLFPPEDATTAETSGSNTNSSASELPTQSSVPDTSAQQKVAVPVSASSSESKIVRSPGLSSKKFTVTPVNEATLMYPDEPAKEQQTEQQKPTTTTEQEKPAATNTQTEQPSQDSLDGCDEKTEVKPAQSASEEKVPAAVPATSADAKEPAHKESVTNAAESQPAQQAQNQAQQTQSQRTPAIKSDTSVESLPSGYTSQESTVPRAKQKGQEHMDFENLKQKLDQLSGKQKPGGEMKALGSLPTTPSNQIGVDPGQPLPGTSAVTTTVSTTQATSQPQAQSQAGQPVTTLPAAAQPQSSVAVPQQPPPQPQQQQSQPHRQVPVSQPLPIAAASQAQPTSQVIQYPSTASQYAAGTPTVPGTYPQVLPQHLVGSHYTDHPLLQQQATYNTWHGGQNPLLQHHLQQQHALSHVGQHPQPMVPSTQQPMSGLLHAASQPASQTMQYLQQQQHLQQQQQQLQYLQNLLHQQQQVQQQLAAQGIYVPINQLSLPHPSQVIDNQSYMNIRRQLDFAMDPIHHADSCPAFPGSNVVSPPPAQPSHTTGLVRPLGSSGLPLLTSESLHTLLPKVKRVERPMDIHNLEQALIEKLHRHRRAHLGAYLPPTTHDMASLLASPPTPGQLPHGLGGAHPDHAAHHLLQALQVHPETLHPVTHPLQDQAVPSTLGQPVTEAVPSTTTDANVDTQPKDVIEAKRLSGEHVDSSDEKPADDLVQESKPIRKKPAEETKTVTKTTKLPKSRFSVTVVKDDPLRFPEPSDVAEKPRERAPKKLDFSSDTEKPVKKKGQVSKRGRFSVTTVEDPVDDPVPLKPEPIVPNTTTQTTSSQDSSKSEAKSTTASLSDRVTTSSLTSGSDYQATVDSVPTSGENSAENTAGSDITPALSKAASTMTQQMNTAGVDTVLAKVTAGEAAAVTVTTKTNTVGIAGQVITSRDVYNTAMVVSSTSQMAGLGTAVLPPHQSVNPPLVAHMVADSLPPHHSQLTTAPHLTTHQHLTTCQTGVVASGAGGSGLSAAAPLSHFLASHHHHQHHHHAALATGTSTCLPASSLAASSTANVSTHGWRKSTGSLPVLAEQSVSGSSLVPPVHVVDDSSSSSSSTLHVSTSTNLLNQLHARYHSQPHGLLQSNRPSNVASSRALGATYRRQSAPAVPAQPSLLLHASNARGSTQPKANEHSLHDASAHHHHHVHVSTSGPHFYIGSTPCHEAGSPSSSCVSDEVSRVFCVFLLLLLSKMWWCRLQAGLREGVCVCVRR